MEFSQTAPFYCFKKKLFHISLENWRGFCSRIGPMSESCSRYHTSPRKDCPASRPIVRNGFFIRKSDRKTILRWRCLLCKKTFSQATSSINFRQHRRDVNQPLLRLVCSAVSQRRSANLLKINPKTVVRKTKFLALQAKNRHRTFLINQIFTDLQFDEIETFEHTKCKPLSIPMIVNQDRKILGFSVARMPAKGLLAKIARKKYGFRPDERRVHLEELFESLKPFIAPDTLFESDECPRYPSIVKRHFQQATHKTYKGKRGCIVGQGELKKIGWDPLFPFNHTAAMLRANMNRLFRRTWCTTKTIEGLTNHLWIYVGYHNEVLTA